MDLSEVSDVDLGLSPLEVRKEKSGFVIGGVNSSALIEKLREINGQQVDELEAILKPGHSSQAGFLGQDDSLLKVLADDNKLVVEKWGLTHQKLARPLQVVRAVADRNPSLQEFRFFGRRFKIDVTSYRGMQRSPFEDNTGTNKDVTITNLENGKSLTTSLLVPEMIARYGFYEGPGTSYRLKPQDIVAVFDFIKP